MYSSVAESEQQQCLTQDQQWLYGWWHEEKKITNVLSTVIYVEVCNAANLSLVNNPG